MMSYVGSKIINAKPMTLGEYNEYRGWTIPPEEDPTRLGYMVEYLEDGNPNHGNHANYISWSPADTFDRHYLPMGTDVSDLLPHVQRLLGELVELKARIYKLTAFLKSETTQNLNPAIRHLLNVQLPIMLAYASVLESRVDGTTAA